MAAFAESRELDALELDGDGEEGTQARLHISVHPGVNHGKLVSAVRVEVGEEAAALLSDVVETVVGGSEATESEEKKNEESHILIIIKSQFSNFNRLLISILLTNLAGLSQLLLAQPASQHACMEISQNPYCLTSCESWSSGHTQLHSKYGVSYCRQQSSENSSGFVEGFRSRRERAGDSGPARCKPRNQHKLEGVKRSRG